MGLIGSLQHLAVGGNPLVDFDNGRGQPIGFANVEIEQPRPILIADFEDVA